MENVVLYDTTLRDGSQQEGISLSVEDKLKVARKLDELGVHYIEGGWPGANRTDTEFFQAAQRLSLQNARLAAFGSTRRPQSTAAGDPTLQALLRAQTPTVTLVGKTWDLHVTRVLETTLEENLAMLADSIRHLKGEGREVFLDAEHFFDGYKENPSYAIQCLKAAAEAGADCLVLCDTNGGTLPHEVAGIVARIREEVRSSLGIHTHNDTDTAVASALAALQAGAVQVQGTVNGYGERCGNANLLSVLANLHLKMQVKVTSEERLAKLTEISRFVSEVVNIPPLAPQPYVGANAFTHKAGLHASAVAKVEHSYQHIPPDLVGNSNKILVSELAGRSNIAYKLGELGLENRVSAGQERRLVEVVKEQENRGFQYENADASFALLVYRLGADYAPPFELVDYLVLVEKHRRGNGVRSSGPGGELLTEATLKLRVAGQTTHTVAEGNGPVNALDDATRKALEPVFSDLKRVQLVDYKVRVVNQQGGTGAIVRVLVESTDGEEVWRTVGASTNIIEASWMALADSLEYWLLTKRVAGST